jgi:hypothetical protein
VSPHTRRAYRLDLDQFLAAAGIQPDAWEHLAAIRPEPVAAWREPLSAAGQTNSLGASADWTVEPVGPPARLTPALPVVSDKGRHAA